MITTIFSAINYGNDKNGKLGWDILAYLKEYLYISGLLIDKQHPIMIKKILFFPLLAFIAFGVSAQSTEQKTLREVSVYFGWNKTDLTASARLELSKLLPELKANPAATIRIVGWTDGTGSERANASMSLRRAESVKAYLTEHGIAADKITTAGNGVDKQATDNAKARRADITVTVYVAAEATKPAVKEQPKQPEAKSEPQKPAEQPKQKVVTVVKEVVAVEQPTRLTKFSLRTNLLYWLGGAPNLGVEWQPGRSVGILVNGGYAPFASNSWKHNWGGWFVAPEVRWYLGETKRWFVGGQFLAGGFNLKPKDTGHQGTVLAGGVTGGYKMRLSKCFDMDFSLGLGYGHLEYDSYRRGDNGVNVFTGKGITKNTFMPIQAGVSLIWKR